MERDFRSCQIKLELEDSKVPEDNYEEIPDSFIKTEVFHNDYEVNEDQIRTKKNSDINKDISNVKNKYKHLVLCLKKLTKNEIQMYQDLTKKPKFGTGAWNKKIECKICGKILTSRHSMLNHVKNHFGLTFDCDVCHKKFTWKTNLNDHKITHKVTPNLFPCPKCGKIFMQKCRLNGHIRTVHDPSKLQYYQCHQCDKSFKLKSQLTKHVNTDHLGITTQKASSVSDKSISTKNLNEHMKIQSGIRIRYPCDVCYHTFARPSGVKVHKLNVHSKINVSLLDFDEECKICFKMMKSSILENHGKYHSGENTFLCEICLKSAPTKSALYNHNLKWHEEKIVTWKECPVCNKSILAYNLDKHVMKKHSGIRYPCDLCNQTFARPDGARYHKLTVHSKINVSLLDFDEECKICFKLMKSSIMENHGKYHSGENPFLCTICFKSAPSRNAFNNHNSKWHEEKEKPRPYSCSKCPQTFKLRINFEAHKKLKLCRKKPPKRPPKFFKCEICSREYAYAQSFKAHKKLHDGVFIKCQFCAEKFILRRCLKIHIIKSHSDTLVIKKENPDPEKIENDCILGL